MSCRRVGRRRASPGTSSIAVTDPSASSVTCPRSRATRRSVTIADRFAGIRRALADADVDARCVELDAWGPQIAMTHLASCLTPTPRSLLSSPGDSVVRHLPGARRTQPQRWRRIFRSSPSDDEEFAAIQRPGLTTARLPYEDMATCGVDMLLGRRGQSTDCRCP